MQNEKKKQPSSKLKSFYLSCRRHFSCSNRSSIKLPINPNRVPNKLSASSQNIIRSSANSPFFNGYHNNETGEGNLLRVYDLERELEELEEWFCSELTRLKHHFGNSSDTNDDDPCNYATNDDSERQNKFERLDYEGGYLYTFNSLKTFEGACRQDLSVQISSPALVPPMPGSSTISEVLNQMAEMGKEKLMSWLLESMPMTDISTSNIQERTHIISSNTTPNNVLEAILLSAIDKLRELVTEGLQIQMGTKQVVKWQQEAMIKAKEDCANEGSVIMVVIIQARDPNIDYQPINEMMVGLIEARIAEDDDETGFLIMGVYVVGLVARRRNGEVIHNCLWCVSA